MCVCVCIKIYIIFVYYMTIYLCVYIHIYGNLKINTRSSTDSIDVHFLFRIFFFPTKPPTLGLGSSISVINVL